MSVKDAFSRSARYLTSPAGAIRSAFFAAGYLAIKALPGGEHFHDWRGFAAYSIYASSIWASSEPSAVCDLGRYFAQRRRTSSSSHNSPNP